MSTPFLRTPVARAIATATLAALAMTACASGDDAVSSPTNPGIDVGEPNGPADGQGDGDASGTRPADQEFTTEERVQMLFGSTQEQAEGLALEFGWNVRVGRIDAEQYALTEDYAIGRMTIELDSQAGGEPVVTVVVVELEDGPRTFNS